jgi:NitT/TauT family transport system ATP-binding protein
VDTHSPAVFECSRLSKTYTSNAGSLLALDDVTLKIEQGDLVSLLGPSGCGKSTLLNLFGGLLDASAGDLLFQGKPVTGPSRDIGMMFQSPVLFPWRTILENVMLSVEILGLDRKEYTERARGVLASVGLDKFVDAYPKQLSGGMQQRAALSRVLVYDPKVLLLDEPFGALDEFTREAMNLELLRLWEERGYTIILVTHNISEAVFLSKRVAVMTPRPGRVAEIVEVDLPQPRTRDVMRSDRFSQLCFDVRGVLGVDR